MVQSKILVVDDEKGIRWVLQKGLEKKGYAVDLACNGKEALEKVEAEDYSMIFLDIRLPDICGLDVLGSLRQRGAEVPVVVITAQNTMKNAIEAMKKGAFDYVVKPFDLEAIYLLLENALSMKTLKEKVHSLQVQAHDRTELESIVGKHRAIQDIFKIIGKVADRDVNVLIQGESGTGKELVARALHYHSSRSGHPFSTVNCAAIPKELLESELFGHEKGAFTGATATKIGKFEEAHRGTFFLDEIGDMDPAMQAKLLRTIQDKTFRRVGGTVDHHADVRILAATNKNIEEQIGKGLFREDLFYRLNVVAITLPSLRERREDIPVLVQHFLGKLKLELGVNVEYVSPEAMEHMTQHYWKGNVRELENVIKRAMVLTTTDTILSEHLPTYITQFASSQGPKKPSLEEVLEVKLEPFISEAGKLRGGSFQNLHSLVIRAVEKTLFRLTLQATKGNQSKASALLGINRNTLRKKLTELGMNPKEEGKSKS